MNINDVTSIMNERSAQNEQIKEILKNKDIPLSERWTLYEFIEKKGVLNINFIKCFSNHLVDEHKFSAYEDLYMETGSTQNFSVICERFLELREEKKYNFSDEQLDEWKECVLQSGYESFCNTW